MQDRSEIRNADPDEAAKKVNDNIDHAHSTVAFYLQRDQEVVQGDVLLTGIVDLLADLEHLVDRVDGNWFAITDQAETHFTAEQAAIEGDEDDEGDES